MLRKKYVVTGLAFIILTLFSNMVLSTAKTRIERDTEIRVVVEMTAMYLGTYEESRMCLVFNGLSIRDAYAYAVTDGLIEYPEYPEIMLNKIELFGCFTIQMPLRVLISNETISLTIIYEPFEIDRPHTHHMSVKLYNSRGYLVFSLIATEGGGTFHIPAEEFFKRK